jgi:hypothetical protein
MINELEYLEAMNQLKTKFDENEKEVKKLKKEVVELKKYIMTIYGLARIIDSNFLGEDYDGDNIRVLIEMMRGYCSMVVEQSIMGIPPDEE